MPTLWNSLLYFLSEITSENHTTLVCCPHCGNRDSYVKYGFYSRYLFDDHLTKIQRYRCDNDLCPHATFSILPHAFLRIHRASLCMLIYVLTQYELGNSIASIARDTGSNWPRTQRWIKKAREIKDWLGEEYKKAPP